MRSELLKAGLGPLVRLFLSSLAPKSSSTEGRREKDDLGARLRGRTATQRSKKGSENGCEEGFSEGFLEGGLLWDLQ